MTGFNTPKTQQYTSYGKQYEMEHKHRARMLARYKIKHNIDNNKYNIKIYNKQ